MKNFIFKAFIIAIFGLLGVENLRAQDYRNQLTVNIDNDQYINPNHDRYYTDGTIFTFTRALHKPDSAGKLQKKVLDFQFGQQIYNSRTAHVYAPYIFDRPLTGYLFLNSSIDWLYKNESALTFTFEAGTIGPNSLGGQVQSAFHKFFKLYPVGPYSKYGLKNAFGVDLSLDYKKLLYRAPGSWFDISADPEGTLGNTFTNVDAGMLLRFGHLSQLFSSASTNSRVTDNPGEHQTHEFYFFAEPQLTYVAYNATIQGGLFVNDKGPTFGIYHIVYVQQLGLQFASARWNASYTAFIKTREVKSTALGDQWASISIAYRFGRI
jgi:hypothetical protein